MTENIRNLGLSSGEKNLLTGLADIRYLAKVLNNTRRESHKPVLSIRQWLEGPEPSSLLDMTVYDVIEKRLKQFSPSVRKRVDKKLKG